MSDAETKSKATFYLSDRIQAALDSYWTSQPRHDRTSKSQIVEAAIREWLEKRQGEVKDD